MKVRDVMDRDVRSCTCGDNLETVARILWEGDCGIVPVLSSKGHLEGVVTDRDLCMAAYTQGLPLRSIGVDRVMARALFTCTPEDSVESALRTMGARQVRRLPVIDERGQSVGILSLTEVCRAAARGEVDPSAIVAALAAIGQPRVPKRDGEAESGRPGAGSRVGSLAARQVDTEC